MNEPGNEQTPQAPAPVPAPAQAEQVPAAASGEGVDWSNEPGKWHRVSPKYAVADLILNLLLSFAVVGVLLGLIVAAGTDDLPLFVLIGLPSLTVLLILNALLAFRRVKAIGYVLREDDLLFRRGILFERVIAVPYGRLQLVDVTRGPLLRALGLATLKFVTASAATGVNLPGLRYEEAEQLRDRLVELAETRRSGL